MMTEIKCAAAAAPDLPLLLRQFAHPGYSTATTLEHFLCACGLFLREKTLQRQWSVTLYDPGEGCCC